MASAIKFGTASHFGVRNSVFSNQTIYNTRYGIAIFMIDGGTHEHCLFENIVIRNGSRWKNDYPIFVDIHQRNEASALGRIKGLSFRNISIQSGGNILIASQPDRPMEDLKLDHITFTLTDCNDVAGYSQKPRGSKTHFPLPELAYYGHNPAHFTLGPIRGLRMAGTQLRLARKLNLCDRSPLWLIGVEGENIVPIDLGLRPEKRGDACPRP